MGKISQLLICGSAVALASFVVGCNNSSATSNQVNDAAANIASNKTTATQDPHPHANAEDKMPRVKVQDAMKEVASGKAVVIDVRGTEAYKMAHIKGALDVPLPKLEGKNFDGLPKDKRIIAYCT